MVEIALTGIKVVLIFAAVISSVVFLNDFGLLVEKLALFCLVLILFLCIELATADVSSPDALHLLAGPLLVIELPFNLEHAPVLLNDDCGGIFLVPVLFSLVELEVVGVNHVLMTSFSLF